MFEHPGGNHLMVDDINVFKSVHPGYNHEKYGIKFTKPRVEYEFDSSFGKDIKTLWSKKLQRAPVMWWVRFGLLNGLCVYNEYHYLKCPTIMNTVALGVIYAGFRLCIGHDGSHGAVGSKYINEFCSYYMDFIGNTNYAWHTQHILSHHPYTNEYEHDPDVSAGEPYINYENSKLTKKNFIPGILFLGYLIVYDPKKLHPPKYTLWRNIVISYVLRLYLFYKLLYVSFWHGQLMLLITGGILGSLFSVSHNTENTSRNMLKHSNDWYKNQVETSSTYGGYWAGFLTGGLNYQIEHHVFPHMNSYYYPQISKKFKDICEHHGVRYNYYISYFSNLKSYLLNQQIYI